MRGSRLFWILAVTAIPASVTAAEPNTLSVTTPNLYLAEIFGRLGDADYATQRTMHVRLPDEALKRQFPKDVDEANRREGQEHHQGVAKLYSADGWHYYMGTHSMHDGGWLYIWKKRSIGDQGQMIWSHRLDGHKLSIGHWSHPAHVQTIGDSTTPLAMVVVNCYPFATGECDNLGTDAWNVVSWNGSSLSDRVVLHAQDKPAILFFDVSKPSRPVLLPTKLTSSDWKEPDMASIAKIGNGSDAKWVLAVANALSAGVYGDDGRRMWIYHAKRGAALDSEDPGAAFTTTSTVNFPPNPASNLSTLTPTGLNAPFSVVEGSRALGYNKIQHCEYLHIHNDKENQWYWVCSSNAENDSNINRIWGMGVDEDGVPTDHPLDHEATGGNGNGHMGFDDDVNRKFCKFRSSADWRVNEDGSLSIICTHSLFDGGKRDLETAEFYLN